jgi:hypothetical protein
MRDMGVRGLPEREGISMLAEIAMRRALYGKPKGWAAGAAAEAREGLQDREIAKPTFSRARNKFPPDRFAAPTHKIPKAGGCSMSHIYLVFAASSVLALTFLIASLALP